MTEAGAGEVTNKGRGGRSLKVAGKPRNVGGLLKQCLGWKKSHRDNKTNLGVNKDLVPE